MSNLIMQVCQDSTQWTQLINAIETGGGGGGGTFYSEEYYNPTHYTNVKEINVEVASVAFTSGEANIDITQYIPAGYNLSKCIQAYFVGTNDPYFLWVKSVTNNVVKLYCYNVINGSWYSGTTVAMKLSFIVYK